MNEVQLFSKLGTELLFCAQNLLSTDVLLHLRN